MTTQEIKDLIASKIAGQGSAVDAGSALPEILGGVADLLKNQQDITALTENLVVELPDDLSQASQDLLLRAAKATAVVYENDQYARTDGIANIVFSEEDPTTIAAHLFTKAERAGYTEDKKFYPIAIFSWGFGVTSDSWGNGRGFFIGIFYSEQEDEYGAVYYEP